MTSNQSPTFRQSRPAQLVDRTIIITRALKRDLMWNYFSNTLPLYCVPEFPKSGGTWFSQMLSDALELPFYRNHSNQKFRSSVISGHKLYDSKFKNVTVVFRDGRDVMVSAYHHFMLGNNVAKPFGVIRNRRACPFDDYSDVQANLPRFIEYMFTTWAQRRRHFSWAEFVDSWLPRVNDYVTYEALLSNAAGELERTINRLTGTNPDPMALEETVKRFSFKAQTGREAGQEAEKSFARKGVAGDWKNVFSPEACRVFDRFAGSQLIALGYEESNGWVKKFSSEFVANSQRESSLESTS